MPALPSARYELLARVQADPRFREMPGRSQAALSVAIVRYADGVGRFWPKTKTWAQDLGVSRSTIVRAIQPMVECGLVRRTPYLRPDGTQGSTTYEIDLDPTRWHKGESPCADDVVGASADRGTRRLRDEPQDKVAQDCATRTGDTNGRTLAYGEGVEASGSKGLPHPVDPVLGALREVEDERPRERGPGGPSDAGGFGEQATQAVERVRAAGSRDAVVFELDLRQVDADVEAAILAEAQQLVDAGEASWAVR